MIEMKIFVNELRTFILDFLAKYMTKPRGSAPKSVRKKIVQVRSIPAPIVVSMVERVMEKASLKRESAMDRSSP